MMAVQSLRKYEPRTCLKGRGQQNRHATHSVRDLQLRIERAFSPVSRCDENPELTKRLERASSERLRHKLEFSAVRSAIMSGEIEHVEAAGRLTLEADHNVQTMLSVAIDETCEEFGPMPGRFAVMAMGKFGGAELTLGSDLDLIFVCDPEPDADYADASHFFQKVGQKLVRLLSWTPDWDALFEIDTRLRPHGGDGELVVTLAGFRHYVNTECWAWELQALTRLRAVAGDVSLTDVVMATALCARQSRVGLKTVLTDITEMRMLMDIERPAKSNWDVKLMPGGLIDIEFLAQALLLKAGAEGIKLHEPNTCLALKSLVDLKLLRAKDGRFLIKAWNLFSAIRQIQGASGTVDLLRLKLTTAEPAASALAPLNFTNEALAKYFQHVRQIFNANLLESNMGRA